MTSRSVSSVSLEGVRTGLPPVEEFYSVEAWLRALPGDTTPRIGLDDGTTYLTSATMLISSARLAEVVSRVRIQRRLGEL